MPCTTILAGKKATCDGSTMMARNEDCGAGRFMPKKFVCVRPEDQPRHYKSVLTGFEMDLDEDPLRYTAVPNAPAFRGVWGESGVNSLNVAMTETETITSNGRVLGADPLVEDGVGEEDMLTVVLPYIRSAREGVLRLGGIIEKYGTCEMNGVGFQDGDEVWWLESVGGHHWIARRVPDDCCAVIPNQQGIDALDLDDALGEGRDNLCSRDLKEFIAANGLDRRMDPSGPVLDVRGAFGSREDADHSYNTPRAWVMLRYLAPRACVWDGPDARYGPESDDLPWCIKPERKVTVEDVKYVLSSHFQGTPYDPYGKYGDASQRGRYRPIGVNRTNFAALTQIRPGKRDEIAAIEWIAMGSNVFNAFVPFYMQVNDTPAYFRDTTEKASTSSFYWTNRLIAVMADAHFSACASAVERYQKACEAEGHRLVIEGDRAAEAAETVTADFLEERNRITADRFREMTDDVLDKVLYEASLGMKNAYARSDA